MASFNSYTGNGSTTNRAITFPYISQSHVHVYLDGVENEDWTWFDSSTIQFETAPANGVAILIQRETPVSERLAEFTNGEALLDEELNISALQALYAAEEAKDRADQSIAVNDAGVYDFNNKRGTNVATPTAAGDVVNKAYADTIISQTTDLLADAEAAATAAEAAQTAAETAEDNTATLLAATTTAKDAAEDARDEAVAAAATLDTSLFLTKADNLDSVTDPAASRTNLGLGDAATKSVGSAADLKAMTSDKVLETAAVKSAMGYVDNGDVSGNITPDFTQFINARWRLTGNSTFKFPTVDLTPVIGRSGMIEVVQDGTGTRTLGYDVPGTSGYIFDGGSAISIDTTANRITKIGYHIRAADRIELYQTGKGVR